jgi:pimeloyl-ACP methyl ester carboxylesterase
LSYNDSGPTVVLVHGGCADASMWTPVVAQLRAEGVPVTAAENPLRSLHGDTDHIARVIGGVSGGVVLVGHGYGGAVIGGAAGQVDNAVGLVYVAGYALELDESVVDVARAFPDPTLAAALRPPVALVNPDLAVRLDPQHYRALFAGDLPAAVAAELAAMQRPIHTGCLIQTARAAAWHTLPSWYLVATDDRCVHPDSQRFMAHRAGARTSETAGSHAVARSQPTAVADVVLTAVHVLS